MIHKKVLFLLSFIILLIIIAVYVYYRPIKVEVSAIKEGPVVVLIAATGRVEAKDHAKLSSRIGGRIVQLPYDAGDRVKKGELLLVLESEDIDAKVEEARQRIKASHAHLKRLRAGSRPEEIAEQQARVLERESERELAKANERRGAKLFQDGYISRSEYDDLFTALKVAKQRFEAENKRLALVEKGPRQEEIEEAYQELLAAQSVLKGLESDRNELFIHSPLTGVVTVRFAEPGETVSAQQAIIEVADLTNLEVKVQVEETDAGKVKTGQNAYLLPDIFPDRSIKGKVVEISPIADYSQGTIEVTVIAEEDASFLKPGMTVDTSIEVQKITNSLLVPFSALIEEEGKVYVYVISEEHAQKRAIKTGIRGQTYVQLISGLEEGDLVVTSSHGDLRDRCRVIIKT